jgi:hypothetical protein
MSHVSIETEIVADAISHPITLKLASELRKRYFLFYYWFLSYVHFTDMAKGK